MITLDRWLRWSRDDAQRRAEAVAAAVGADEVALGPADNPHAVGRVARFRVGGRQFVLVPGGEARLGYDPARFVPTPDEMASFLGAHEVYLDDWRPEDTPPPDPWTRPLPVLEGQIALFPAEVVPPWLPPAADLARVRAYLAEHLTPARVVTVPSLLVAAVTSVAGRTEVTADHPLIVEHLRTCSGPHGSGVRVADDDQAIHPVIRNGRYWIDSPVTFDEVAAGRRLLSPDEWEWAHGLGRGTLFPWGERLRFPDLAETISGLRWPGQTELTSVPGELRGGDDGRAFDHSLPDFYHSLPRSPAFRLPPGANRGGVRGRSFRDVIEVPAVGLSTGGDFSRM